MSFSKIALSSRNITNFYVKKLYLTKCRVLCILRFAIAAISFYGGYSLKEGLDSGLACLIIILKFLNIRVSQQEIEHIATTRTFPLDDLSILSIAKTFKLSGKLKKLSVEEIKTIKSPVIVRNKEDRYFIIAKIVEGKAMILYPDKRSPELVAIDDFNEMYSGVAIILKKKKIVDSEVKFGFKWFIPTILKFRSQLIQVFVAIFTIQCLGILTPIMTQVVIDKVLVHNSMSTLCALGIGIAIVYVFELTLGIAKNYVFTHTTNRIDVILNYKLFKHLFALPLKYFESRRVGETVARVRELDSIRNFLTGTPLSSIIDLLFVVVYIVILFMYSVPLTLLVIASLPVFAILSAVITPIFKERLDEKFNVGAESQSFLVEAINGVQTIKSFALEESFERKWGDIQADYVKASYKTSMVSANSNSAAQFIQKIFELLILVFGAVFVMNGDFTVGALVAFRMLSGRVTGPVLRLVQLWQEYQQTSLSVKRIGDIFNAPVESITETNISNLPKIRGKISFEKVTFRYRLDLPEVIKDITFSIDEGKVIGIVGRSGSGKSTISKLIQRLYIPESGKITVDDIDISLVNPLWLRSQIGVVLQENYMFSGTVSENISIHMPNASAEQIIQAAITAGAHEFITALPNGYDTVIGDKGIGLSGGQKQRIAIARAIISNPRILIFDEATSALDYESESIIQKNINNICRGRTVLIIAHRLSTLKNADMIMVIENGRLAEYDTHINLMKSKGIYSELYKKQQLGV